MKLVLHIGDMKTGSSSIQKTLSENAAVLAANGVIYPTCDRFPNHCLLTVPFDPKTPRMFLHRAVDRAALLAKADAAWDSFAKQVRDSDADTVVLSAENLLQLPGAGIPDFMKRIHAALPGLEDVHIIAYVRRNSQHYASRLQQRVKASYELPPVAPTQYHTFLKAWASHGRLTAREMARPKLRGEDVVQDFLHLMQPDLDKAEGMVLHNQNDTISAEGMVVMMNFRRDAFAEADNVFHPKSSRLLRDIRRIEASAKGDSAFTKPNLKPELVAFLDQETPDLVALRDEFDIDMITPAETPIAAPPIPGQLSDLISYNDDRVIDLYRNILALWRPIPNVPKKKRAKRPAKK